MSQSVPSEGGDAGQGPPGADRYAPLDSPIDRHADFVRDYVASDGRQGHGHRGGMVLLLTMRGHVSGMWRRTPVGYAVDGDDYLIAGTNAGGERDPLWVPNLLAEPEVVVQVKGDVFDARADLVTTAERGRLWDLLAEVFPVFREYETTTAGRQIPIFRLRARRRTT